MQHRPREMQHGVAERKAPYPFVAFGYGAFARVSAIRR